MDIAVTNSLLGPVFSMSYRVVSETQILSWEFISKCGRQTQNTLELSFRSPNRGHMRGLQFCSSASPSTATGSQIWTTGVASTSEASSLELCKEITSYALSYHFYST